MYFAGSLIFILLFQLLLQFLFVRVLQLNFVLANLLIDLILAIMFACLNFRGREKLRNPEFHKQIVYYFIILTLFSVLFFIV